LAAHLLGQDGRYGETPIPQCERPPRGKGEGLHAREFASAVSLEDLERAAESSVLPAEIVQEALWQTPLQRLTSFAWKRRRAS